MRTYPNKTMTTRELKLGDVVKVNEGPWGTAIVRRVTPETTLFFRPYGTTADFSYTGGVICYTGTEEFSVFTDSDNRWLVYERQELK